MPPEIHSALTTNERLAVLETQMEQVSKDVCSVDGKVDKLGEQMDAFIAAADERYASKLVERIVYSLVGIIVVAVVGALVALVVK